MRSAVFSGGVVITMALVFVAHDLVSTWARGPLDGAELSDSGDSRGGDPLVEDFESRRAALDDRVETLAKIVRQLKRTVTGLEVEIEQLSDERQLLEARLGELVLELASSEPTEVEAGGAAATSERRRRVLFATDRGRGRLGEIDRRISAARSSIESDRILLGRSELLLATARQKIPSMDEKLVRIATRQGVRGEARDDVERLFSEIETIFAFSGGRGIPADATPTADPAMPSASRF